MFSAELSAVRLAVFLVFGPPLLAWLFFTNSAVLRTLVVVSVLVFIQDSFATRRYLWLIGVGPSVIVAYVALMASFLRFRGQLNLGAFFPLWAVLLVCAGMGLLIGSLGTGLAARNVSNFQELYVEGFFYFVLGYIVFHENEEVDRFFNLFPLVGAGVALAHLFCIGTGYRFRDYARADIDVATYFYGGLFNDPNTLGSFYAIAIPIALVVLMRGRLWSLLRLCVLASLAVMAASLLMTGSRGGLLATVAMTGLALLWSRVGAMRALAFSIVGALVALTGYLLATVVLAPVLGKVFEHLREEGLRTGRLQLWRAYLGIIAEHPFGVGLATENVVPLIRARGLPVINAHNAYLEVALRAGVLALATFLAMVSMTEARLLRAIAFTRDATARRVLVNLALGLGGFLLAAVAEPIYHLGYKLNQLFWLLSGIGIATSSRVLAEAYARRDATPSAASGAALELAMRRGVAVPRSHD